MATNSPMVGAQHLMAPLKSIQLSNTTNTPRQVHPKEKTIRI